MRLSQRFFVHTCLALLASLGVNHLTYAQNATAQKIPIQTADGVDLQGYWYAAQNRKDNAPPPVVMLLHSLGETATKTEWQELAGFLQKNGYSVLSFDFRGHGASTSFRPQQFYAPLCRQANSLAKVPANQATLDFNKFSPSYYPVLVNDIAAAKATIDLKNDAGECNSSSLIVVGAETGATLGSIWLNSEWHRYRYQPAQLGLTQGGPDLQHPYGMDTIAAIFISIAPNLGKNKVDLKGCLRLAAGQNVPMVFVHNADDKVDTNNAKYLEKYLKPAKVANFAKFTGAFPVTGAENLKGRELLKSGLKTIEKMKEYLDDLTEKKANAYVTLEFTRTQYLWRDPNTGAWVPANTVGDRSFVFDTFVRFMPRRR